ncbi:MAG TPA: hypothetical protein VLE96_00195, partial [Chlamydiales bacterium]|nr:hypothetical protein [Chlamydiales bacterium]
INLTRKQRKFFCLERATIAGRQGASEDKKFAASLTQLNMTLFIVFGIRYSRIGYYEKFGAKWSFAISSIDLTT